jgi:CHAT domain-containing protein/tetratricopeptide (TPR) repeat protein
MLTTVQISRFAAIALFLSLPTCLAGDLSFAQTTPVANPAELRPPLKSLGAEDARLIKALDQEILVHRNALEDEKAVPLARQILEIRTRSQGKDHWETISARLLVRSLERISSLTRAERAELKTTFDQINHAKKLYDRERFNDCLSLLKEALVKRQKLLGADSSEAVQCLNNLAMVLGSLGKFEDANSYYRQAVEGMRLQFGENHPEVATAYSNLALNLQELHRLQESLDYHEKALTIVLGSVGAGAHATAQVRNNLGMVLDALGRHPEAHSQYEKALEVVLRDEGETDLQTIRLRNNLAANALHMADFRTAEAGFRRALETCRKVFPPESTEIAANAMNLAHCLDKLGNLVEAEALLREAFGIFKGALSLNHPDTAGCINNLAANLSAQGRPAEAETLYRTALSIMRAGLGEGHPRIARLEGNLAHVLSDQGRVAEAESLCRSALATFTKRQGQHEETANALNNLGMLLVEERRFDEAEPLLLQALEMRSKLLAPTHPSVAQSHNNLGGLEESRQRPAQAIIYFRKAYEIRRARDPSSLDTAESCNNLAASLDGRENFGEAERLYREALSIRERLLSREHPLTAQSYKNLGGVLEKQGKYAEAEEIWTTAAQIFEATRLRIGYSGSDRVRYSAGRSPLLRLAALLARRERPQDAWRRLEEHLGRGLLDEFAERQYEGFTVVERETIRKRIATVERLERIFEPPSAAIDQDATKKRIDALRTKRDQALLALQEYQQNLIALYGPHAGKVATLEEVQAILPVTAALVAWVDYDPSDPESAAPGGEHWGVVVRSKGVPVWIRLSGTGKDNQWTGDDSRLASLVRVALHKPPSAEASPSPLFHQLRAQRLDPLRDALGPTSDGLPAAERLYILTSAALAAIPIEALLEPDDPRTVSYAPSASILTYLRNQPSAPTDGGLLALGDPVLGAARSADGGVFDSLPGARAEVEKLKTQFESAQRPVQVLLGPDASEAGLLRLADTAGLRQFTFIHLATHGVIDDAAPQRSAVILSQTGLPDPLTQVLSNKPVFDGRLTVREIQRGWSLNAALVTLSACETARGQYARGEGFIGFTQALLVCGARCVCLSLWKVDDRATSMLMERFYRNLLSKDADSRKRISKAKALREAKAWLRNLSEAEVADRTRGDLRISLKGNPVARRTRFDHPYYWAGFILVGDPN